MKILILVCLAALLGGCASPYSVSSDFRFAPGATQGLVVGSITYDSAAGIYSVEGTSRGGASFYARVGSPSALIPTFDEALKRKGGTFAVALPPGSYTLQRWTIDQGRMYTPRWPIGIAFNVAPGQVTYLGNFHFDRDGEVALEDLGERDLPILRSRFPAAGAEQPAYRLRPGTRIDHLGNEPTARGNDATLYVATAAVAAGVPLAAASAPNAFDPTTMASIQDSTQDENRSSFGGTRFFVVTEVDGKKVERNANTASQRASAGRGPTMRVVDVERPVPAGRPVRVRLNGMIDHAAPIQSIFAAVVGDGQRRIDGVVDVELKPDSRYRVNGRIDEYRSQVWLEEIESGKVVGTAISSPPTAEGVKALAAESRFTCCNFHHDSGGWVSDAISIEQPFVPAGTPIRVYEYASDRAKAQVNERALWLGLDYGRKQQTVQQMVAKLAVKEDPSARIAGYPEPVQAAIRAGKVLPAMTKEQALVALGYPRADLTRALDDARWVYRTDSDAEFVLVWGNDERLVAVEAAPELRALVLQAR